MDYEKFKQDMEQDVLKNLANRGIEAETDVQHIDKLNDGYDALTVKAPGSVIGVNINLSSAFEAYEDGRNYIDIVERASDQADKVENMAVVYRFVLDALDDGRARKVFFQPWIMPRQFLHWSRRSESSD